MQQQLQYMYIYMYLDFMISELWYMSCIIFASQVSDSLALIYPLADLVGSPLPSSGRSELPSFTYGIVSQSEWM